MAQRPDTAHKYPAAPAKTTTESKAPVPDSSAAPTERFVKISEEPIHDQAVATKRLTDSVEVIIGMLNKLQQAVDQIRREGGSQPTLSPVAQATRPGGSAQDPVGPDVGQPSVDALLAILANTSPDAVEPTRQLLLTRQPVSLTRDQLTSLPTAWDRALQPSISAGGRGAAMGRLILTALMARLAVQTSDSSHAGAYP